MQRKSSSTTWRGEEKQTTWPKPFQNKSDLKSRCGKRRANKCWLLHDLPLVSHRCEIAVFSPHTHKQLPERRLLCVLGIMNLGCRQCVYGIRRSLFGFFPLRPLNGWLCPFSSALALKNVDGFIRFACAACGAQIRRLCRWHSTPRHFLK